MREQLARLKLPLHDVVGADEPRVLERPELQAIHCIRDACKAFLAIELEGGHSDEGDPWCIIHDSKRRQVILHIARIDRHYVVVCPGRSQVYRISYLTAAVEAAFRELEPRRI